MASRCIGKPPLPFKAARKTSTELFLLVSQIIKSNMTSIPDMMNSSRRFGRSEGIWCKNREDKRSSMTSWDAAPSFRSKPSEPRLFFSPCSSCQPHPIISQMQRTAYTVAVGQNFLQLFETAAGFPGPCPRYSPAGRDQWILPSGCMNTRELYGRHTGGDIVPDAVPKLFVLQDVCCDRRDVSQARDRHPYLRANIRTSVPLSVRPFDAYSDLGRAPPSLPPPPSVSSSTLSPSAVGHLPVVCCIKGWNGRRGPSGRTRALAGWSRDGRGGDSLRGWSALTWGVRWLVAVGVQTRPCMRARAHCATSQC